MIADEPRAELALLAHQLAELNHIGAALAAERDTAKLLDLILTKAREITSSDAGSLYLTEIVDVPGPPKGGPHVGESGPHVGEYGSDDLEPAKVLRFVVAQNSSVTVPFRTTTLEITGKSIAGYVALTGEPVRLDDAYEMPAGVPYGFNRSFDQSTGYRTQSVLAVPMRTPKGSIVGVVQLINAKEGGEIVPYSDLQQALAVSLASQAAVAVENSQLYAEIHRLFEGFVRASVVAIEARDPATSGHSFRVANLTVALAEAADRADSGPFEALRFSREEMRTIRYASLLHDFGKVGVREEVLVKAKKLYPAQLELIRERFKLARRSRELAAMKERIDFLLAHGRDAYLGKLPDLDVTLADELAALEQSLAAVEAANEPSVLPDGSFDRLQDVARLEFLDTDGANRPLLHDDEVRLLSLRKGSLSEAERTQIESHVMHTYRFLSQIPWTREIRRIPAIAAGHHEKLNGRGYPYKLSARQIPVQTRMMTISDIFDALSASDRPYKKAVPIDRALHILDLAVKDGELDAELFRLFVDARVFDKWLVEPFQYLMRAHPHLFEINTWPWLDALSRGSGRFTTLGGVPDSEWDDLRNLGIDIVYLMGVWKRSPLGRELARSTPVLFEGYDRALPGWTPRDVVGSAYCVAGYEPDPRIGTWDELAQVRARLHTRGMQLIVDFVPNHTGFDHPWVRSHPDRYVQGSLAAFRRNPAAFRVVDTADGAGGNVRFIACGRDPYFAPWTDVAQLDYSNPDARAAMVAELDRISQHADGVRCDMAMLALTDVFRETWKDYLRFLMPATEFWTEARSAVPTCVLLAEVYWDLEWRLQQLGFDFTYDKRLYDRLLHAPPAEVRGHLMADAGYQRRLALFIENHDEPRSAPAFGDRLHAAATVVSTLPGLRFYYQGQFEGRTDHLPVQLGRWREEPGDARLGRFYGRLLAAADADVFHSGEWRLLDVHPAGDGSSLDLAAWRWVRDGDLRVVVVNLGGASAQGLVQVLSELRDRSGGEFVFEDQLNGDRYPWTREALHAGLYVKLDKGAAHIFRVTTL